MRFTNLTGRSDLNHPLKVASALLDPGSKMMDELIKKNDFKFNSGYGPDIVTRLVLPRHPIPVLMYKSINPFTKAIGYFDGETIRLNTRKLGSLSLDETVGLLLHEYSHFCGFTHGNNLKTAEKVSASVPYFLSENAGKWI